MARAEAEAASHAATTTALQQMCLQLHTTAADNAAANKAAMTQVLLVVAIEQLFCASIAIYYYLTCFTHPKPRINSVDYEELQMPATLHLSEQMLELLVNPVASA